MSELQQLRADVLIHQGWTADWRDECVTLTRPDDKVVVIIAPDGKYRTFDK